MAEAIRNRRVLVTALAVAFIVAGVGLASAAGVVNRSDHRIAALLWLVSGVVALAATFVIDRWNPVSSTPPARNLPAMPGNVEAILLFAILSIAGVLRFHLLADYPRVVVNDETMFSVFLIGGELSRDAEWTMFPNLFRFGTNSFASLSMVVHGLPAWMFGNSTWSFRLGCAAVGLLSVVPTYFFARRWWGPTVGLLAAFVAAILPVSVYWSRIALNNIDAVLVAAWVLAAAARALDTRRCTDALWVGVALGLGWHTYHSTKAFPAFLGLGVVWFLVAQRRITLRDLALLTISIAGFVIVVVPLLPHIFDRWEQWKIDNTNRFEFSKYLEPIERGDYDAAWYHARFRARGLWAMVFTDPLAIPCGFDAIPFGPVYPPSLQIPFWVGFAFSVLRIFDPRYAMMLIWFLGILVSGGLTNGGANKYVGMLPIAAVFPALGVGHLYDWVNRRHWIDEKRGVDRARWLHWAAALWVLVWVDTAAYESWNRVFRWGRIYKEPRAEYCRLIHRLATPATIYFAGGDTNYARDWCVVRPDSGRQILPFTRPPDTSAPNTFVVVFPGNEADRDWLRANYPQSVEEVVWDTFESRPLFTVVRLKWTQIIAR